MRKWKLKKDTPTAVAGTICTTPGDQEHIIVDPYGVEYDIAKIDNFDKWFEEVKEFKEWRLKEGERYKCMGANGELFEATFLKDEIDEYRELFSNLYPLDASDETIIKEQKLIPQAMHRLRMAAKKAWFEFDGSEGPDWDDCRSCHWRHLICFDRETYRFYVNGDDYQQIAGVVYFPTEESCQAYIDSNPEDMKLLFGVE